MLFNSFTFVYFFIVVFIAYWAIPTRFRWGLLLGASYFFYMSWEPAYILLILFSTAIDYFVCLHWTSSSNTLLRKRGLITSVFINLSLLVAFKYYNFFQSVLHDLFWLFEVDYVPIKSELLLPVGISFFTFQTLSYSIDVYRNKIQAEKHFGKFALYVSFFPQLIAGPIERAQDLLTQFKQKSIHFKGDQFKDGVLLFLWGLFKKVVVADNIRVFTDHIFDNSDHQNGGTILFASVLFAIQLYADFSGYSDMAIGTAKMLGIELKQNFRTPYFSQNVSEFWNRWHISLSHWLRDYIYIPLGGNQKGKRRTLINLFLLFILSGIWHGASWNFVIWGTLHALYVIFEKLTGLHKKSSNSLLVFTRSTLTFIVVSLSFIPLRAVDFIHLRTLVIQMYNFSLSELYFVFAEYKLHLILIVVYILFAIEMFIAKDSISNLRNKHLATQYSISILLILLVIFLGNNSKNVFFYFQF